MPRMAAVILLLAAVSVLPGAPVAAQVDWSTVAQEVQTYYEQVSQAQAQVNNGQLDSIAKEYESLVQQLKNNVQQQLGSSVNNNPVYELQVVTPNWTTAVSATESSGQWQVSFNFNASQAFNVYVIEPSDLKTLATLDALTYVKITSNVDTTTNTMTLTFQTDASTNNTATITANEPDYLLCLQAASYDSSTGSVTVTTVGQTLGFKAGSQTNQLVLPGTSSDTVQLVLETDQGDSTLVTVPGGTTLNFQVSNGAIRVTDSNGNLIASLPGTTMNVYATVATVTFSGQSNIQNGVTTLASNLGTLGETVQKLYGNVVQVETAEAGWSRLVTNLLMFIANLVTALLIAWTVLA